MMSPNSNWQSLVLATIATTVAQALDLPASRTTLWDYRGVTFKRNDKGENHVKMDFL